MCVCVWLGLLSNCFALFLQVGASPSLPALKPSPPTYTVNQFLKLSEEPVAGISETANQKKDDIEGQFVCGLIRVHVANVFRWPSAWYYVWTLRTRKIWNSNFTLPILNIFLSSLGEFCWKKLRDLIVVLNIPQNESLVLNGLRNSMQDYWIK